MESVTRRKDHRLGWIIAAASLTGLCIGAFAAVVFWRGGMQTGPKAKVRAWLRENTPTGDWEEIRWGEYEVNEQWGRIKLKYRTDPAWVGVREEWFIFNNQTGEIVENRGLYAFGSVIPLDNYWGMEHAQESLRKGLLEMMDGEPEPGPDGKPRRIPGADGVF